MSGGTPLPPVAPTVLVEAVDGLPARLRKKLDDAVTRAAGWVVSVADDRYTVMVDGATTVTLVTTDGVVRTAGAAHCTCLLAPNCLHRVAVLSRAPVEPGDPEPVSPPVSPARVAVAAEALTPQQSAAVDDLWRAAVAVLEAGVTGSGVVARTALLRAAHDAQAGGVYRAATAARSVASLLQAARDNEPQYRLADLTDAARDLLGLTHRLRRGPAGTLLGAGRRPYELRGSLRLYGLCTTAVLANSGHAGVITYVVDRDGTLWTVADIAPGDAHRAAGAGNATVALGECALTHRALTRAGLVVTGATASPGRQLGAGRSVRAVASSGAAWQSEPLATLWAQPLHEQVRRAFGALALPVTERGAGDDLLFLSLRVLGTDHGAVYAATGEGTAVAMRVATDHPSLAYRENLWLLGRTPGLAMLVVGRPDPARLATVYPLAVAPLTQAGTQAPTGEQAPTGWALPAALSGHVDLAFDRLHRSHLPGPDPSPAVPIGPSVAGDPALDLLRSNVERVVSGGRTVLAFATPSRHQADSRQLSRARLETGAALLDRLTAAAGARPRDTFGRLAADDGTAFAQAWLAAAVYTDAAYRALVEASWLPDPHRGTQRSSSRQSRVRRAGQGLSDGQAPHEAGNG